MGFDYFYGKQSQQFAFYRIPRVLFTDNRFRKISTDEKVLYGLLLDPVFLSQENGWVDEEGRVYIIFTLAAIRKAMDCSEKSAIKYLTELEEFGLIERIRQGLGKPSLIYVKNFIDQEKLRVMTCKNYSSPTVKVTGTDQYNLQPNNTNYNNTDLNNHFVEKYYRDLGKMKAVQGANNKKNEGNVTPNTVFEIHKILRSCFRQAVKWGIMEKNPAVDATLPKRTKKKREIWDAETLMQAIEACDEKWLEAAFHLAFTATLRLGEILALTWDCVEISEEAIEENRCFIVINKIIERVSVEALEALEHKDVITVFPSKKKNNRTVLIMKTPKTETSNRKVYIPSHVGKCLVELKKEQDQTRELLGSEYKDYNLVLATSFGMPIGGSHLRDKMQEIIDEEGLPDVVFHSLRHTSVTYKLKLSGGDIKAVQGDSGHAQADMVTEVYGHILDEERKKNAQMMERAFYNKENLNPDMHGQTGTEPNNSISVPGGIDAELLAKVLENPEMVALLTSLAKTMKIS